MPIGVGNCVGNCEFSCVGGLALVDDPFRSPCEQQSPFTDSPVHRNWIPALYTLLTNLLNQDLGML